MAHDRYHTDWTPELVDRGLKLMRGGMTYRMAAEKLGTTKNALIGKLRPILYPHTKLSRRVSRDDETIFQRAPAPIKDTRSLTGRLAGDPLPSRSALDARR